MSLDEKRPSMLWSLCLEVFDSEKSATKRKSQAPPRQKPHQRIVIQMASTSSMEMLYSKAEEIVAANTTTTATTTARDSLRLRIGFPSSRELDRSSMTLVEAGIQNQEKIVIVFPNQKSNNNSTETTTSAAASLSPTKRPRRAAAQKAMDSFDNVIQQQDALESASQKKSISKNKMGTKSPPKTNSRFQAASTVGRRLVDGSLLVPKTTKRRRNDHGTTMDPVVGLLGTVENNNGNSKESRLMRQGWKQAVHDQYEQNKAAARLAAFPHSVHFQVNNETIQVTFSKGVQGRGDYQEEVDYISKEAAMQVIASIYPENPEALRPQNLALLSPRMFWSIAYHAAQGPLTMENMESALRFLNPDLDWSFLHRRREMLSAKARENLRQARAATSEPEMDWEAAAQAIEAVEHAMEYNLVGGGKVLEKQQQEEKDQDSWELTIPTEPCPEELMDCILEHLPPNIATTMTTLSPSSAVEDLVKKIMDYKGNSNNVPQKIQNIYNLANFSNDVDHLAGYLNVNPDIVLGWVEVARQVLLERVQLEICENNSEAVTLLQNQAQTGTPADLAMWLPIPEMLHAKLLLSLTETPSNVTVSDVRQWCRRAKKVLALYPWLTDYTTPIQTE